MIELIVISSVLFVALIGFYIYINEKYQHKEKLPFDENM